jgi:hypothetical protein
MLDVHPPHHPTHLSRQQLDQTRQLTETALEKHILFGYAPFAVAPK